MVDSETASAIAAISNLSLSQGAVSASAQHQSASDMSPALQQSPTQIDYSSAAHPTQEYDNQNSARKDVPLDSQLTLRSLITSAQGGIVIGRQGKNVAELRELTGCKAGVSKVVPGVADRVLTVTGPLAGVALAYSTICQTILSNPSHDLNISPVPATSTTIRLLISHNLMGSLIGRAGNKIKHIQELSSAKMVAAKEMLPQSTERVVEVQGTPEGIKIAILEIGKCLIEDWERGLGTVLFSPAPSQDHMAPIPQVMGNNNLLSASIPIRRASAGGFPSLVMGGASVGGLGPIPMQQRRASTQAESAYASIRATSPPPPVDQSNIKTQNISIPSDMVGCIIGRGGSKITDIRRLSKSKISIAKAPHDETGERLFSIVGTPECNEMALFLLYNQLETEKVRRIREAEER